MLVTRDLRHFQSDRDGSCEAFYEYYSMKNCYAFSCIRMFFDFFYDMFSCQSGCFEF